jgi:hypothetical protein
MSNAKTEIENMLNSGEIIESVVLGEYGWGGYGEDEVANPIPEEKCKVPLTWKEASKYMEGWSTFGGYGSPECYSLYVWTNERVIFIRTYDGSTSLASVPRNPVHCNPAMFGGG